MSQRVNVNAILAKGMLGIADLWFGFGNLPVRSQQNIPWAIAIARKNFAESPKVHNIRYDT